MHEVAQAADPDARIVYIDTDPIAVTHSRATLSGDERSAVVEADGRNPAAVPADMASRSGDVVRIATVWNDGYLGAPTVGDTGAMLIAGLPCPRDTLRTGAGHRFGAACRLRGA